MIRAVIKGTGSALPARVMANAEFADLVDTSDEWIVERTGIRQRHIAGEGESTSTLAAEAARKALESAGIQADEIDLIVLATATPDHTFPATATQVQALLGCKPGGVPSISRRSAQFFSSSPVADSLLEQALGNNLW